MYAGESRPELEDAWDDLMRAEVFRATAEDLSLDDEAVNDAVTLEHGGYLASLSVYHALHCIEWIKRNYARAHTIDELHGKEGHLGMSTLCSLQTKRSLTAHRSLPLLHP